MPPLPGLSGRVVVKAFEKAEEKKFLKATKEKIRRHGG